MIEGQFIDDRSSPNSNDLVEMKDQDCGLPFLYRADDEGLKKEHCFRSSVVTGLIPRGLEMSRVTSAPMPGIWFLAAWAVWRAGMQDLRVQLRSRLNKSMWQRPTRSQAQTCTWLRPRWHNVLHTPFGAHSGRAVLLPRPICLEFSAPSETPSASDLGGKQKRGRTTKCSDGGEQFGMGVVALGQ